MVGRLPEWSKCIVVRASGAVGGVSVADEHRAYVTPLWVGEAAVSDVKGFGENEGAQRPGIKSRKYKQGCGMPYGHKEFVTAGAAGAYRHRDVGAVSG